MNLIEARYPTILAVGILLAGLSAFATVTATAAEQGTTSYKWTDEKGVLHYGDRVPPEHSKRERSSLNEQGVEVGRFEAERTFEQLAEEERRTEEARRVASHDVFLRATYASVREIERLRDQRLQQLRDEHARLKAQAWAGFSGYDAWFDQVNNAALAVQAAYDDLAPAFEQLFEREGADFPAFHAAVRRLAALPRAERRSVLAQVSAPGRPARPVPP